MCDTVDPQLISRESVQGALVNTFKVGFAPLGRCHFWRVTVCSVLQHLPPCQIQSSSLLPSRSSQQGCGEARQRARSNHSSITTSLASLGSNCSGCRSSSSSSDGFSSHPSTAYGTGSETPFTHTEQVGDLTACRGFINQCSIQFELSLSDFPTHCSKVVYIIFLLTVQALAWALPLWERQDHLIHDYLAFIEAF